MKLLVVAKLLTCHATRELPVDGDPVAVHVPVPRTRLLLPLLQRGDSPFSRHCRANLFQCFSDTEIVDFL